MVFCPKFKLHYESGSYLKKSRHCIFSRSTLIYLIFFTMYCTYTFIHLYTKYPSQVHYHVKSSEIVDRTIQHIACSTKGEVPNWVHDCLALAEFSDLFITNKTPKPRHSINLFSILRYLWIQYIVKIILLELQTKAIDKCLCYTISLKTLHSNSSMFDSVQVGNVLKLILKKQ